MAIEKIDSTEPVRKQKSDLSLAPHEWASLYKQLEPITGNGANSIRHLEGAVLILLEKIQDRLKKIT